MSKWIIQNDEDVNSLDLEYHILLDIFKKQRFLEEFSTIGLKDIVKYGKGYYPVGTIEFVSTYLKNNYGIERENPIEIPSYLRTDEFLKRKYDIVTYDQIPQFKHFFLKDVSELKAFTKEMYSYESVFAWEEDKSDYSLSLDKSHKYLVSDVVDIISEYRVYVIDGEIENIGYYNGDCTVFPDVNLIKKAIGLISYNEKFLKSYTIDVMVTSRGTSIIEIHNFASVGLYSALWGNSLLLGYKQGIEYLLNDNSVRV